MRPWRGWRFSGCVADRNVPLPHSIADALALPAYREQLEGVAFYFGEQRHPAVDRTFRIVTTSRRSNASGDLDKEASCARALVSALLHLRSMALSHGADAVIDVKSNYRHNEVSSKTEYQCATGFLMSGVALKGTLVRLNK